MTRDLMQTPSAALGRVLPLAAMVAVFVVVYADVIAWLVDDWDPDGHYSHGFLVVPLALYFAWERRRALSAAPRIPSAWGFVALLAAMAMLVIGTAAAETFVARLSMVGAVAAIVWFLCGWEWVRTLRFPLAFLLLMIPIPSIIFNRIAFPLQLIASRFGETALGVASVPVFREGNLIALPTMTLEVAEACSGIRSLVALFTLSVLYAYTSERRAAVRALLLVATVPIAIVVNGLRVAFTGLVAYHYGAAAADGFFHSTSGWAMFLVAGAALVGTHKLANLPGRWTRAGAAQAVAEGQPS